MEIIKLSDSVISVEEKERIGIKSISIISESDILNPRLIIKYTDGIKTYFHIKNAINTDVEFRKFLEKCEPKLKD